ncbi:DUF6300 family protein [Streptomyces sp. NPDC093982]|uniref:DUF6300 family protein n=1 Tax=Streptomyces sp. NPDC093982 TaxID=3155077 RepID=UPI00342F7D3D
MAGRGVSGECADEESFLVKVEDTPLCPQCDGPTMLLAHFPHNWGNGRVEDVSGLR